MSSLFCAELSTGTGTEAVLSVVVKSTTSSFVGTCIQPHPLMKYTANWCYCHQTELSLSPLGLTYLFKLRRLDASAFLLRLLPVPEDKGHETLQVLP